MNPKEKAEEIQNRFFGAIDKNCEGNYSGRIEAATACARICVEEIIRVLKFELDYPMLKSVEYWNEVLNHLK